jgi:protein TonB
VLKLGHGRERIGAIIGLVGALLLHGGPATDLASSLVDLQNFAKLAREVARNRLGTEVDVDMTKPPPPPPPPPPEPEPPPEKVAPQPRAANEPPPPPPAPAEAAKVITQEPDPNEPVDFTGDGFVTGNADRYAGGITAREGSAKQAVRSTAATLSGVPGGTGTAPAPPPPPPVDLSKAPTPSGGNWNDCGFPAEADIEGINEAVVTIVVTVSAEGRAKSVTVVKDPGFGFGRLARDCSFRKSFNPGLDSYGKPVTKTTPPLPVRFRR